MLVRKDTVRLKARWTCDLYVNNLAVHATALLKNANVALNVSATTANAFAHGLTATTKISNIICTVLLHGKEAAQLNNTTALWDIYQSYWNLQCWNIMTQCIIISLAWASRCSLCMMCGAIYQSVCCCRFCKTTMQCRAYACVTEILRCISTFTCNRRQPLEECLQLKRQTRMLLAHAASMMRIRKESSRLHACCMTRRPNHVGSCVLSTLSLGPGTS